MHLQKVYRGKIMRLLFSFVLVIGGFFGTQAVAENVKLTKKLCRKVVDEAESLKYRTIRSGGGDAGAVIVPADLNPTFKMPQNIQGIGGSMLGSAAVTNAPVNVGAGATITNSAVNTAVNTSPPNLPWGGITAIPSNSANGVSDTSPEDPLPTADQSKPEEILIACREAYPEL